MIQQFCAGQQLGWVFPADVGYQCFPDDPQRVRKPDVSFVASGRIPNDELPQGYMTIAPDLAIEVVSPNDLANELERKKEEYLRAGVDSVWIVHPRTRTVTIYRVGGTVTRLTETDELCDESVLPGFGCPLREIFPPQSP